MLPCTRFLSNFVFYSDYLSLYPDKNIFCAVLGSENNKYWGHIKEETGVI